MGRRVLTESQKKLQLAKLGRQYEAAKAKGDKAGMQAAHAEANKLRASEPNWYYDKKTGQTVEKKSAVAKTGTVVNLTEKKQATKPQVSAATMQTVRSLTGTKQIRQTLDAKAAKAQVQQKAAAKAQQKATEQAKKQKRTAALNAEIAKKAQTQGKKAGMAPRQTAQLPTVRDVLRSTIMTTPEREKQKAAAKWDAYQRSQNMSRADQALRAAVLGTKGSIQALGETAAASLGNSAKMMGKKGYFTRNMNDVADEFRKSDVYQETVNRNGAAARTMTEAANRREKATEGLNPTEKFLMDAGISIAQNVPGMALSVVNPVLGSAFMGATAAGSRAYELQQQGENAQEAFTRGLVSGGIEALTERFSVDSFLKTFKGTGAKTALKNVLRQMGVEASEEGASYILNYVADKAAKDKNATYSWSELAAQMGGGAISGGVFGGLGAVANRLGASGVQNQQSRTETAQRSGGMPGQVSQATRNALDTANTQALGQVQTPQTSVRAVQTPAQTVPQAEEGVQPGTIRQETWQEGEVKPRLRPEYEERAESTYRSAEEEDLLQRQVAEIEAQMEPGAFMEPGSRVFALDRNNYGQIIDQNDDGTYRVHFVNQARHTEKMVDLDGATIQAIMDGEITIDPDTFALNRVKAENQLDALAAPVAEQTVSQYDDLVSKEMRDRETAYSRAQAISDRHQSQIGRAQTVASYNAIDSTIFNDINVNTIVELSNENEALRLTMHELKRRFGLTEADLVDAREIAAGRPATRDLSDEKLRQISEYADVLHEYNRQMQPVREHQHEIEMIRTACAEELLADSDNWQDAKMGLALDVRTPERVFRRVMGDTDATQTLIDTYITPVHRHEAESIRWQNAQRARLRALTTNVTHEESVYAHMLNRMRENPDNSALSMQCAAYFTENRAKINVDRVDQLISELTALTREWYSDINEAGLRNGDAPLEFRQNYIPSIPMQEQGKWWNRMLRGLGIETISDQLPTSIAGRTEDFRPTKKWQRFRQERRGIDTEFDAVRAVDTYISNAAHAIFHTDDIRNLRILEESVRFKYSDDGRQAELNAIRRNGELDPVARTTAMQEVWERENTANSTFASWLTEYTNQLAGKKSFSDRNTEKRTNRSFYRTVGDIETKIASNMVGFNFSTALTNFIPFVQGKGEVSSASLLRAVRDFAGAKISGDTSWRDGSDFLTNRAGTQNVVRTRLQKTMDAGGAVMGAVDEFTSNVLHRARALDNMNRRSMSVADSVAEADSWTAGLMGDRSLGAMPTIFNDKNFLAKALTMFQLEVANQYGYFFEDVPHNQRAQGRTGAGAVAAVAGVFLQVLIASHLFNDLAEEVTGRRSALDPVEMINDFVGQLSGYAIPSSLELIRSAFDDGITADDFETEQTSPAQALGSAAKNVMQQLPGTAVVTGGGRVPVTEALPNPLSIAESAFKGRFAEAGKELVKPVKYIVMPTGGSQLSKTLGSIDMMRKGGSYSTDFEGNEVLQFPYINSENGIPRDVQAIMFGKWATPAGRALIEDDFKGTLSDKQTRLYNKLRDELHADERASYDAIRSYSSMKAETDEDGNTTRSKKEVQREALLADNRFNAAQKQTFDRYLFCEDTDEEPADYRSDDSFLLSTKYKQDNKNRATVLALRDNYGVSIRTTDRYLDGYKEIKAAYANEDTGRATKYKRALADQINNDKSLTSSERDSLATVLLLDDQKSWRTGWDENNVGNVMGVREYISYALKMAELSDKYKGHKDEDGKADGGTLADTEMSKFLDDEELSDDVRGRLMEALEINPTPYRYDMLTSKNETANLDALISSGLAFEDYYDVKQNWKNAKNEDGTYTYKKDEVVQHMRDLGWSEAQIIAAGSAFGWKMISTKKSSKKSSGSSGKSKSASKSSSKSKTSFGTLRTLRTITGL